MTTRKINCRLEVMKVFDDAGEFSHWAVNLHVAPLPNEDTALDFAEKLAKTANTKLPLDQPFPDLQRSQ